LKDHLKDYLKKHLILNPCSAKNGQKSSEQNWSVSMIDSGNLLAGFGELHSV